MQKAAFDRRYLGLGRGNIKVWLRNVIVFTPLQPECVGQVVLLEMKMVQTTDEFWKEIHTFGFEEGRSATEIATAIRLMAAVGSEWVNELVP